MEEFFRESSQVKQNHSFLLEEKLREILIQHGKAATNAVLIAPSADQRAGKDVRGGHVRRRTVRV